jgi:hypothetical protein
MALSDVVACAGGLVVARRGAGQPSGGVGLHVGPVAPVELPGRPGIVAQRADGVEWRRHWLGGGALIIEFVDVAVAAVDERSGGVSFDRALAPDIEEHLLFDHILPLVLAWRGGLVLHGGVISREDKGVALVGSSGAGKSTFTAFAWQQGWVVGGDDGAVLYPTAPPTAEPTYATVRLTTAGAELLGVADAGSMVAGKVRLDDSAACAFRQEPVELHMVAIVERATGPDASFERLRGIDAHAELFGSTFHADLSADHLPAIVDGIAAIVESTIVGRLRVPEGLAGLHAAEQLLRRSVDEGARE